MIRSLNGKTPQVHSTAYVNEMAYLVGDVVLGEGSSVWPAAVVRGDDARIVIGKGTNIQDGAIVHADTDAEIGDAVTLGHGAVVHCAKIGSHCLIGNNATLLDDVELGEFCLVAAGAVVPPATKVPPRSLVAGVPARVRSLDPKYLSLLESRAALYVRKAQWYKAAGL